MDLLMVLQRDQQWARRIANTRVDQRGKQKGGLRAFLMVGQKAALRVHQTGSRMVRQRAGRRAHKRAARRVLQMVRRLDLW